MQSKRVGKFYSKYFGCKKRLDLLTVYVLTDSNVLIYLQSQNLTLIFLQMTLYSLCFMYKCFLCLSTMNNNVHAESLRINHQMKINNIYQKQNTSHAFYNKKKLKAIQY